jgi:hypothetical protein
MAGVSTFLGIRLQSNAEGRCRLARLTVTQGQSVHRGDEFRRARQPRAQRCPRLGERAGGRGARRARPGLCGVRVEQVTILEREIETARADVLYAEQQFARKSKLAADGFASRQDLDEASAVVGAARARLDHAQEAYQAARLGPIREELAVADAKVKNAGAAVAVIAARVDKLRIRAPSDGTVALIVALLYFP